MFFPILGDPYYNNVGLLLTMEGANNQTAFVDFSPTPKLITCYGNTQILTAQSKWGNGSGYFDGSGDYLSIPTHTDFSFGSNSFTIEFWMRPAQVSSAAVILDFRPSGASHSVVVTQPGTAPNKIRFACGDANFDIYESDITSTATLTANVWHHIALVRNSATFSVYVNGTNSGNATWSGSILDNTTPLLIGALTGSTSPYYSGYLQDLRITKGVARYTADFTPPTLPFSYYVTNKVYLASPTQQPSFTDVARRGL